MKKLKVGKVQRQAPKWWVGRVVTCPKCEATFKLEARDADDSKLLLVWDKDGIQIPCQTLNCYKLFTHWRKLPAPIKTKVPKYDPATLQPV